MLARTALRRKAIRMPTTGQSQPKSHSRNPTPHLTEARLRWAEADSLKGMYPDIVRESDAIQRPFLSRVAIHVAGAVGVFACIAALNVFLATRTPERFGTAPHIATGSRRFGERSRIEE